MIDDAQRADARRSQVQRRRRTDTAGADQKHPAFQQLQLARLAHFRHDQVARIALAGIRVEHLGNLERQAFVLPAVEPAGQRTHVAVAHALQVIGREQGALAAGAGDHQGTAQVRNRLLDPQFQETAVQPERAARAALGDFGRVAHVDQGRPGALQFQRLARADFRHIAADVGQPAVPGRAAPRHRRQDRENVAFAYLRLHAVQRAHVVAAQIDVHELARLPVRLHDPFQKFRVIRANRAHYGAHTGAFGHDFAVAPGKTAQRRGNAHGRPAHAATCSSTKPAPLSRQERRSSTRAPLTERMT